MPITRITSESPDQFDVKENTIPLDHEQTAEVRSRLKDQSSDTSLRSLVLVMISKGSKGKSVSKSEHGTYGCVA